jgi:hypothetical protein
MCAACGLAPAAALAGTVDQQQIDSSGSSYAIASNGSLAQTFTAGLIGGVDRVDLNLQKFGAPTASLSIEIRDVLGGVPGSTVLASASVPSSSVPTVRSFVPIGFATPAAVVAGTQYAIVAFSPTPFGPNDYAWSVGGTANPYEGGGGFGTGTIPPAPPWTALPAQDFAFQTYVAAVATAPGPTGERSAALKKCKKNHSAKKRKKCRRKARRLPV